MRNTINYNILSKMYKPYYYLVGVLVIFFTGYSSFLHAADAGVFKLSAAEWAQPKRAETIMNMPAIRDAMQQFNLAENARMTIQYPGGEAGVLWASELKGWLTSLGVESVKINVVPGSVNADIIRIQITVNE